MKQMNDYDIFVDSIREAAALAERSAASAQASAEAAKAIAAQNRPAEGLTDHEKKLVLTLLRLLAAGNDAAMAACDRLEALWGTTQPEKPDQPTDAFFAALGQAILGKMILGRNK